MPFPSLGDLSDPGMKPVFLLSSALAGRFFTSIIIWEPRSPAFQADALTSEPPEDIKKRWQEYTEELYKKDLHDPDNHDGVITNLESDILECKIKWALESITMKKASGADGILVELFEILKMML